jgi:hypothetical protein
VGLCASTKYNNQPTIRHIPPATTPILANLIMPSPCPPANANNNAASPDLDEDTLQTPTPMTDDLSLPSSKKARTSSISTAMKESQQLKSDNEDIANDNESNVEVIDVDGAVGTEEIVWFLCTPEVAGQKVQSQVWRHFHVFWRDKHPEQKDQAACLLCFKARKYSAGTICAKGGNTSGLIRHMKIHHMKLYKETMRGTLKVCSQAANTQAITTLFQPEEKQKHVGTKDAKAVFKTAVASWIIDKGMPFSMVEEPTFRNMFESINQKASVIVNVDRKSICEVVMMQGRLAEAATQIVMAGQEVAWTTDHWTGPNDQTYSTVTAHFINSNWNLESCILDLKVFKGTTSGEAIYNDIAQVLQKFQGSNATVILDSIGITDTTGNMGKLGQYCRENGRRHGYCTDHNFHCNAILAFNGEIEMPLYSLFLHMSYLTL